MTSRILCALGLQLALVSAAAQTLPATPPESVDLAAVLALARDASPRLALERQSVAMAQAERRTAGAYPNPVVSYTQSRQPGELTNFSSVRAREWSIGQPILLPGQRGARVRAADLGIDAASARLAASANDLAAEAGAAYVALLAAQETQALLAASLQDLRQLREQVAGRQASGMASRYDLLRVDVELADWRSQVAEAEADLTDRQGQLAALLGFPGWRPQGQDALRPLAVPAASPDARENPAIVASRREEAAAQASVVAARRDRLPTFSLNGGQFWTMRPYGRTYAVGLEVEVPLFDTRRGALDKARAEAESATLQRTLTEAQVRAEVERQAVRIRERSAALDEFQHQVAPHLPALKQMAGDAYRLGRSSIIELLDATRSGYEVEIRRIELVAGLMEAQLRLQAARSELAGGER